MGFDHDGDSTADETVAYQYDAGGLRTRLTLPGGLQVNYTYNAKGQLVSLADWDGGAAAFAYDSAGRMTTVERDNGLRTTTRHDAAGRLKHLRQTAGRSTLAEFRYTVDGRGNRTQAVEMLGQPGTGGTTLDKDDEAVTTLRGSWADSGDFKVSSSHSAALRMLFCGDEATLTMGVGPDHSLYDLYLDGGYWDTQDGYAASAGELALSIRLIDNGVHTLEIRNRLEHHAQSSGNTVRFKMLETNREYRLHTWVYGYDGLSRLRSAEQHRYDDLIGTPERAYATTFDVAGNRLTESLALNGGTPTVTTHTYNAANQIDNSGFSYDPNGNLIDDGPNVYTWDRANRLLSMGGHSYAYDGEGRRVSQTVSSVITKYLLDVQPGLVKVLAQTTGSDTTRFVHDFRGILAHEDPTGDWLHPLGDGLHSIRSVVDNVGAVLEITDYSLFGVPDSPLTTTPFAFTGEERDETGVQYHRARYYSPALGTFASLDPFEGIVGRPMSLNGYGWVEGNTINAGDSSGMNYDLARILNQGLCSADGDWERDCSCHTNPNLFDLCQRGAIPSCLPPSQITMPTRAKCCDGPARPISVTTRPCPNGPPRIIHYDKLCDGGDDTTRDACGVMAYRAVAQVYGNQGCLTWSQFVGIMFFSELGNIINPPAAVEWYPSQQVVQDAAMEATMRLINQRMGGTCKPEASGFVCLLSTVESLYSRSVSGRNANDFWASLGNVSDLNPASLGPYVDAAADAINRFKGVGGFQSGSPATWENIINPNYEILRGLNPRFGPNNLSVANSEQAHNALHRGYFPIAAIPADDQYSYYDEDTQRSWRYFTVTYGADQCSS